MRYRFVNGGRFSFVHPMTNKSYTHEALTDFYDTVGVPRHLHTDRGGEFTSKKWKRAKGSRGICKQTLTESHSSWQNGQSLSSTSHNSTMTSRRHFQRTSRSLPDGWACHTGLDRPCATTCWYQADVSYPGPQSQSLPAMTWKVRNSRML